jgi:tryptophan synthase beta chain
MTLTNSLRSGPDDRGHFGQFGGRYVAETLMPLILDLEREYRAAKIDPAFAAEFDDLLEHYVGRPSPLYYAERLTEHLGGAKVYFKRDELNHTGAHKINNCIGQILLAMRMGKTRIIAERALVSTALPPQPSPRALAYPASFSWVRAISSARHPMSFA